MDTLPTRKRNRLENFDYASQGTYFVTICCKDRQPVLWMDPHQSVNSPDEVRLSSLGEIVKQGITQLQDHYPVVTVILFSIMPDHVHLVYFIDRNDVTTVKFPDTSVIIGQLKRWVSKQAGFSLWQKSFFDRIIRSEREYANICRYVYQNPMCKDCGNNDSVFDLFENSPPPHSR